MLNSYVGRSYDMYNSGDEDGTANSEATQNDQTRASRFGFGSGPNEQDEKHNKPQRR